LSKPQALQKLLVICGLSAFIGTVAKAGHRSPETLLRLDDAGLASLGFKRAHILKLRRKEEHKPRAAEPVRVESSPKSSREAVSSVFLNSPGTVNVFDELEEVEALRV
jgi:hypothetical protein